MRARLSDQAISPQKTRLVADLIRGQHVEKALDTLNFTNKKAAKLIIKRAKKHPEMYTTEEIRYAKMVRKRIKRAEKDAERRLLEDQSE